MSTDDKILLDQDERRKYEFRDEAKAIYQTEKGLSEETVREISKIKGEPEFMLKFRLDSLKEFFNHHQPTYGPDLNWIDFQNYTYYTRVSDKIAQDWDEVPDEVKNTFDKLGIPEAEQKFLSGVTTQYESEAVYSNMLKEVTDKGVVFLDTDTGLKEYPEIFKKYFGKLVPPQDNKYAALNSAVWSGGSFIYVPKGVKLEKPLQSYFRINNKRSGQFERTLIIVDDDAELNYVEGCTAPMYSEESLHAAIVEIFVGKRAKMRYTTIQNWSNSILNLVTQRALVEEDGLMEWVDGNIGSMLCMKYPCCVLKGDRAKGSTISVAVASNGQFQDTGAKMIHIGKNTSSTIISKSIARDGGHANFRGQIEIKKGATGSKAHEECDTLILDDHSYSDTIPHNIVDNSTSYLEHEASVSKINEDQLFYLMSRGMKKSDATQMIVMGFLEPFSKELPMEYAVELNQLIKFDMTGSIG
ncbi:MAG: Fe-S cluster assembly protein SufB [Candidatus Enterosoma sp.]|nr:Fe-S cluster assembly protein SufB [Bacilli bacterium]MDD6846844.1 Fe-S cluster assembly protein SufB [bacterium]MDY2572241.1 Fe-S cluster assembly protein SufB [Candidatus Enterosoma sp.]MCI6608850.1 Fe-S cluster assembly protein SufB [Bacilli bacterium]MCI7065657.1 Fe-S cluster assembly protein SufB [Bacilli bacterium]